MESTDDSFKIALATMICEICRYGEISLPSRDNPAKFIENPIFVPLAEFLARKSAA